MGGAASSDRGKKEEGKDFVQKIKSNIEDELARRMMLQREVQMAVEMSKARDAIWVFGSAWALLTGGVLSARIAGHRPPSVVGVPIILGALVLGNMADLAYGNKLSRVSKEAEYILEHERSRFVPAKQAPFAKFYTDDEKAVFYDPATPVGEMFPNNLWARRPKPKPDPA